MGGLLGPRHIFTLAILSVPAFVGACEFADSDGSQETAALGCAISSVDIAPGYARLDWSRASLDKDGQPLDPHEITTIQLTQIGVPADDSGRDTMCRASDESEWDNIRVGFIRNNTATSVELTGEQEMMDEGAWGAAAGDTILVYLMDDDNTVRLWLAAMAVDGAPAEVWVE